MYPWIYLYQDIKRRCENKNRKDYIRYGAKGIKCKITKDEIKFLWFRDKAYLMEKPSIDRKDNNGNYTLDNCQFIELSENSRKDNIRSILQYDLNGEFIKEWESQTEVSKILNICRQNISKVASGKRKQTGGYIWKYKE
jgi:hypothetical protein